MTDTTIDEVYRKPPEPFHPCPACSVPTDGEGACVNRTCVKSQSQPEPWPSYSRLLPWPGTAELWKAANEKAAREDFASTYDPPPGYRYTGEYRTWREGELFLNRNGHVECGTDSPTVRDSNRRHILVANPGTEPPKRGKPQAHQVR